MSICGINWDAIATAVTGGLAVFAAWHVGRKQTRIQELTLNSELYEKRMVIYENIKSFLQNAREHGHLPDQDINEFHLARKESSFLFSESVIEKLGEIYDHYRKYAEIDECVKDQRAMDGMDWAQTNKSRTEAQKQLSVDLRELPETFKEKKLTYI